MLYDLLLLSQNHQRTEGQSTMDYPGNYYRLYTTSTYVLIHESRWQDSILQLVYQLQISAILSHLCIVLKRGSRITCRHRPHDQICKFWQLNMADDAT